jgi:hypothetical protein
VAHGTQRRVVWHMGSIDFFDEKNKINKKYKDISGDFFSGGYN